MRDATTNLVDISVDLNSSIGCRSRAREFKTANNELAYTP